MTDSQESSPTVYSRQAGEVEPDDEDFIAGLMTEVQESPPFTCPYSFHGAADEAKVNFAIAVFQVQAVLMRRRHPWLTFEALDSIVFHSDYTQALKDVSERAGRECQATSELTGAGIAMVVKLGEKSVLIADAGILLGMTADDEAVRNLCIDTALHELCHVYDDARVARLLAGDFRRGMVEPMQGHVFTAAQVAWSEYFANKYSNSEHSSPNDHPKFLAEVVPSVVAEVRLAIERHLAQPDLVGLLAFCRQKVNYLFQCFGYAVGRLSANGAVLEEIAPDSVVALESAGLYAVFLSVQLALDQLDEERDSWSSFDDLQPLMDQADSAFRALGLRYSLEATGLRVFLN